MNIAGRIEVVSTEFMKGWVEMAPEATRHVVALLDDVAIGVATANLVRRDLEQRRLMGKPDAASFVILYDRAIPPARIGDVVLRTAEGHFVRPANRPPKIDRAEPLRIFVLGSPRSGTSKLGQSIVQTTEIPWLGEGHAAHIFADAAQLLAGDPQSRNGLVRFLAEQRVDLAGALLLKQAYFYMHGSASFLDKTPGTPMINAAPFLQRCFPDARFIYMRRNGISNVLSRMAKFGGKFAVHCSGWVSALQEWQKIKPQLPHFIEIEQEEMLEQPAVIAELVANYIGMPQVAQALGESLTSDGTEKTGAGVNKTTLAQTGWNAEEIATFRSICGPTMKQFGYPVD